MNTPQSKRYVWELPFWPTWRYDSHALASSLGHARLQQGRVLGKAQAVGIAEESFHQVVNDIWVQEVIATAAIEGQKLDLDQVRSSVMRMLGTGDGMPSSRHVDGLAEVMQDAIHDFASPLDTDRVCRWQSALFPGGTFGIKRIEVGQFRTFADPTQIVSGRLGKEVVHYRAPDSGLVPAEMARFLDWFNGPSGHDGIARAAIAHLWFETIHPFDDGNGRIGSDHGYGHRARCGVTVAAVQHVTSASGKPGRLL